MAQANVLLLNEKHYFCRKAGQLIFYVRKVGLSIGE